jgi:hypothetical protein
VTWTTVVVNKTRHISPGSTESKGCKFPVCLSNQRERERERKRERERER